MRRQYRSREPLTPCTNRKRLAGPHGRPGQHLLRGSGRRRNPAREPQPCSADLERHEALVAIGVGNQATIIWAEANPLITAVVIPVVMTLAILIVYRKLARN